MFQNKLLLSVLSGLLLMVSFPFSGSLTPLVFVACIPLWRVGLELREAKRGGLLFFGYSYLSLFIFNFGTTWWIWNSTSGGAVMAFVCNTLLMSGALTLGFILFKKSNPLRFLAGLSLSWISFEFLHLNWELSWPWLTMGNYFSLRPAWIQWYEFTGILGGSFWVMGSNLLGTHLIQQKKNYALVVLLCSWLIVPFIWSVGLQAMQDHPSNPRLQETVVLQPNINPYTEKFNVDPVIQLKQMLELARPYLRKATLVIGPETALQEAFIEKEFNQTKSYTLLNESLTSTNSSLLIGASTFKLFDQKHSAASKLLANGSFYESYNTALFMSSKQQDFIHKSKLVLGVEKIPFSRWLPFLEELSIDNGGTSGSLGTELEPKIFRTSAGNYAPIICYESIYGEFVAEQCNKGAQLLCIITNDGWWGNTPGHRQHNQFAALRAIETRKFVVRSGNTGISSVWNPQGECLKQLSYNTKGVLTAKVPLIQGKTFYVRFGDYLGWVSVVVLAALFGYNAFRAKERNQGAN